MLYFCLHFWSPRNLSKIVLLVIGKTEYVPVTTLSRHLKTHQPRPSGASLCKQAGAGTEVLEEGAPSLSQENTRNWCCSPGTGKGLSFGMAFETLGIFQDTGQALPQLLSAGWGWLAKIPRGKLPGLGLMETCPGEVERG